jgi:hypothetical protein
MPSCGPKSQRTLRLWLAAERSGGEAAGLHNGPLPRGARFFARGNRPHNGFLHGARRLTAPLGQDVSSGPEATEAQLR